MDQVRAGLVTVNEVLIQVEPVLIPIAPEQPKVVANLDAVAPRQARVHGDLKSEPESCIGGVAEDRACGPLAPSARGIVARRLRVSEVSDVRSYPIGDRIGKGLIDEVPGLFLCPTARAMQGRKGREPVSTQRRSRWIHAGNRNLDVVSIIADTPPGVANRVGFRTRVELRVGIGGRAAVAILR